MVNWQIIAVPGSSELGHDMWRGPKKILQTLVVLDPAINPAAAYPSPGLLGS